MGWEVGKVLAFFNGFGLVSSRYILSLLSNSHDWGGLSKIDPVMGSRGWLIG